MSVSPYELFLLYSSAALFNEMDAETSRYVSEKINKAMPLKGI
jgi:hypothetical protein